MKEMTPKEAAEQINVMRGDFLTTIGSWTGVKEIPMNEKDYNALKVAVNVCEEYDDLKAKIYAQSTTMLSMEKDISELREENKQLKNCKHSITTKAEDYPKVNSSELQTGDLVKDEFGRIGIFICNSDFREDTGYFLFRQGKIFNTLESMKRNWSKVKHFSGFSEVIDSLNN